MYKNKTVAVVVPAYNEEHLISRVIETMPDFVDHIVVVNDNSQDQTGEVVQQHVQETNSKVVLIELEENKGVGGAITEGYKWCRDQQIDATAVMAGDAQMDPDDLPALLDPVVNGEVDYAKGNRLFTGEAWQKIPKSRYMGNAALSLMTKIASGYWHIADSQTGYTVANYQVLRRLDLDGIYKRYGMPNDILVKLNIYNFRVRDIEIKPIYGIGEKSGIKPLLVIPRFSWLLSKLFFYRMFQKYVIRDFHPLIFFYALSFFLNTIGVFLAVRMVVIWSRVGVIPSINALAVFFSFIIGIQMLLFAMWFDMNANKHLR